MADGDLAQLDDVAAWLGTVPATSQSLVESLITRASRFVCNYTGRATFALQSYSEFYDGSASPFMLLRQWPVAPGGVASLLADGQTLTAWALSEVLPSGGNQRITLTDGSRFCRGRSNVQVTYTSGYAQTPDDVVQAVVELVGEAYKRKDRIGQNSKSLGGGASEVISFSTKSINDSIREMLDSYVRKIPV